MRAFAPGVLFIGLGLGCAANPARETQSNADPVELNGRPEVDGVWEQIGYGKVLQLEGGNAQVFDRSAAGCVLHRNTTLADLGQVAAVEGAALSLNHGVKDYHYRRLAALPSDCRDIRPESSRDPLVNFDHFWQTFEEHYCCFELRGVDWQAAREKYRARLNSTSSEAELYAVLMDMVAPLHDGHVDIEVPEEVRSSSQPASDAEDLASCPFPEQLNLGAEIAERYVPNARHYNRGIVRWGYIQDGVAYVQWNLMLLVADYGLDAKLGAEVSLSDFVEEYFAIAGQREYQRQDEIEGAIALMDRIVGEFAEAEALILDIRFNPGGKDEVALAIMNHLASESSVAGTIQARTGEVRSKPQSFGVEPADKRFVGPTYLLVGPLSASASEIGIMAAKVMPHVELVGAKSAGELSSALEKRLPNGWEYTLSNEYYLGPEGQFYERQGIPPDHGIAYPRQPRAYCTAVKEDLRAEGDRAIEQALHLLTGQPTP